MSSASEEPTHSSSPGDWDLSPYFDAFESETYREFVATIRSDVDELTEEAAGLASLDSGSSDKWLAFLVRLEKLTERNGHLSSYLGCRAAADTRDEAIQLATAAQASERARIEKLFVRVRAAFLAADAMEFDALLERAELKEAAHFLRRIRERARFSMNEELEALTAELDPTGLSAWGRLYSQVAGKLEFQLKLPGHDPAPRSISVARSHLEDPDPDVRRATQIGTNEAWEQIAHVPAACLNAISGTRLRLYERRGIQHFLDPALFDAGITQKTLETMLAVVRERADLAREYLRIKSRKLGIEKLGFQDLMAPLPPAAGAGDSKIPWRDARLQVLSAFGRAYPALSEFAEKAFDQRWIDYSPRQGKQQGGFCSTSSLIDQSRVFITYNETMGDLSTLAHELGHAFHGHLMKGMRSWSRRYPMTLAETASTFAEQLVIDSVLDDEGASAWDKQVMLDSRLQDASTFLLNIPMRFEFEKSLYEERAAGEVSVARLKELMVVAQRDAYGDALDPQQLDPFFWASKLHFYITGISFYNFPYTFGYLFSRGICAQARLEGPSFLPRYEALLRSTGSLPAEEVAKRSLGVNLEAPDFWHASLDLIERDLALFREGDSGSAD